MRIDVNGGPVPHPTDPEQLIAPHALKVIRPNGEPHPSVIAVDTDAHTVSVHALDLAGRPVRYGDRLAVHVLDVRRGGWFVEFPDGARVAV